jgi:hypothetical protein
MKRDNIKNIQNILLNLVENNKHMDAREVKRNLQAVELMMQENADSPGIG